LLREALKAMGRSDLIGNGKKHLVPFHQPKTDGSYQSARRKNSTQAAAPLASKRSGVSPSPVKRIVRQRPKPGSILTQHSGLPPRRIK